MASDEKKRRYWEKMAKRTKGKSAKGLEPWLSKGRVKKFRMKRKKRK